MKLKTAKDQKGFTIVELLIVIVVIGILAAITIVAFNGVQNQAKTTKAQAVASDVQKKAEAYNAINGRYPVLATEFSGTAALSSGNSVVVSTNATIHADYLERRVHYRKCPVGADADTITGARIRYWDFTTGAASTLGTNGTSLSVGDVSPC